MPSETSGITYRLAHTWELEPELLAKARALLDLVFAGIHAIALKGNEPIAHAAVIQRQLLMGDRPLRCGYVDGVAVHPDHQRKGSADT